MLNFMSQRTCVEIHPRCSTLHRCGTAAPRLEAQWLMSVKQDFIIMKVVMSQCAQLMVTGQRLTFCAKVILKMLLFSSIASTKLIYFLPKWCNLCVEVDCGEPLPIPHASFLWDKSSSLGSQATYMCDHGYVSVGGGNLSVCTASGEWNQTSLSCQGDNNIHLCM